MTAKWHERNQPKQDSPRIRPGAPDAGFSGFFTLQFSAPHTKRSQIGTTQLSIREAPKGTGQEEETGREKPAQAGKKCRQGPTRRQRKNRVIYFPRLISSGTLSTTRATCTLSLPSFSHAWLPCVVHCNCPVSGLANAWLQCLSMSPAQHQRFPCHRSATPAHPVWCIAIACCAAQVWPARECFPAAN
jgi:hypothetical protein